jgi:hypothetical protein
LQPATAGCNVPLTGTDGVAEGGTCTFGTSDGEDDVVVQIGPVDLIRQTVNGHQTQPVSGLGDGVMVYGLGSDVYDIYVSKGSTALSINIAKGIHASDPAALLPQPVSEALTTLAKTALGKI